MLIEHGLMYRSMYMYIYVWHKWSYVHFWQSSKEISSIILVLTPFEQPDSVVANAIEQYAYANKVERDQMGYMVNSEPCTAG